MLIDVGWGVFPSRGPSLLGGSGLSWQPHGSSDHGLLFLPNTQSSRAGQGVESCCVSLFGSPARSLETSLSPCWLKEIRTSRALWPLFQLTVLLQLATMDATRLSIPQPREHPSCKMKVQCFHSDVSYAFPVCRKCNRVLSRLKPWSGSIWNHTLKEKHIPELETGDPDYLRPVHCNTNACNCL